MIEVGVAIVAGIFLVGNTLITRNTNKKLKVSNGLPPGFMIEKTYERVQDLTTDLAVHKVDPKAHQ